MDCGSRRITTRASPAGDSPAGGAMLKRAATRAGAQIKGFRTGFREGDPSILGGRRWESALRGLRRVNPGRRLPGGPHPRLGRRPTPSDRRDLTKRCFGCRGRGPRSAWYLSVAGRSALPRCTAGRFVLGWTGARPIVGSSSTPAASRCPAWERGASSSAPPRGPGSRSGRRRTRCATRSRLTSWRVGPTCERCRRC